MASAIFFDPLGPDMSRLPFSTLIFESLGSKMIFFPNLDFLLGALIYTQLNLCIWDTFEKDLKKLEEKIIKGHKAVTPFSTLLFYNSPNLQRIATETFLKTKYTTDSKTKNNNIKKNHVPKKKISIGYYSADFCIHPVSNLIINLLELHDKSKFDLYGFYFGPDKKDEMFKRSLKAFHHFYDVDIFSSIRTFL